MLETFEKNRESRRRLGRRRLVVSVAAALLVHFLLLLFVGFRAHMPDRSSEDTEHFLEITEFIPPEKDKTDTEVKDPLRSSDRSYNSEVNRLKFGISGSPPSFSSSSPPSSAKSGADKSDHSLEPDNDLVRELARNTDEKSLQGFYSDSSERVGNDGDYRGKSADETDISVKEFKHYSYWIKLKRKIENAWRPADAGVLIQTGSNIQTNVRIIIARDGRLQFVGIVTPSGSPRFDREAIRAVKAASPYSPFPQSWENDIIDTVIRFIIVDFSWRQILIQS